MPEECVFRDEDVLILNDAAALRRIGQGNTAEIFLYETGLVLKLFRRLTGGAPSVDTARCGGTAFGMAHGSRKETAAEPDSERTGIGGEDMTILQDDERRYNGKD